MLLCYLQRAQLQQLRVAFNHRGRVREVAQRSRLAARAFESREPFLGEPEAGLLGEGLRLA